MRATRCTKPTEQFLCGKVHGKVIKEIILDPRSTHAFMDLSCAEKFGPHVFDTTCYVELTNGTFVRPYGVKERCHFEFMSTTERLTLYVMEVHILYGIILGLIWLRADNAKGKFGNGSQP